MNEEDVQKKQTNRRTRRKESGIHEGYWWREWELPRTDEARVVGRGFGWMKPLRRNLSSSTWDKEAASRTTSVTTTTTLRIPEGKFTLIKTVPATSGGLFMRAWYTEFVWLTLQTYGKHFHRFMFRDACWERALPRPRGARSSCGWAMKRNQMLWALRKSVVFFCDAQGRGLCAQCLRVEG